MEKKLLHSEMFAAELILRESEPGVMYRYMEGHGYRYASLALGVAEQNTLAGVVALKFMKETAKVQGIEISDVKSDAILRSMAAEYIRTLSLQSDGRIVSVTRDIRFDEAWKFHNKVFLDAGLSPDAWTLNSVFSVMPAKFREGYWNAVLASAGNTSAEFNLAVNTYVFMRLIKMTSSIEDQQAAEQWLNRIESIETYNAVVELGGEKIEQIIEVIQNNIYACYEWLSDFISPQPPPPFYTPAPMALPPTEAVPAASILPAILIPSPPARHRKKRRGGGRPPTTAGGYDNAGHFSGGGVRLRLDP